MIDIKTAIEQSKNTKDISVAGSQCFDFGKVVLVRYTLSLKYVKDTHHARDCEEIVMEGINQKVEKGVNTPKHIALKRVIEEDKDVCYVLEEKCKGINCATISLYDVSYDKMISDLEFVYNIPFDHYKKLVSDGCELYEMGYECKNKNLFYDKESGFWYIDFLDYDKENSFDYNNPVKIFQLIKYIIPKPKQIASTVKFNKELSPEQQAKRDLLEASIEAKFLLAIKSVIPNFEKYEKFYLYDKSSSLKQYLMEQGFVKKDLFKFEDNDYPIFNELYQIVINTIINNILNNGVTFWDVEVNDIRINSDLFSLISMWENHKDNQINKENYQNEIIYRYDLNSSFTEKMLNDITKKLEELEKNENSQNFLNDMYSKYGNQPKL